ncbi:MAG: 4'-phosphopantetheinyl transferase family protein [Pseudanabaenaceae cyanobacterium]
MHTPSLHWQRLSQITPCLAWLSPGELVPSHHRFYRSRTFLRQILGQYLHLPPAAVPLTTNPSGKPVLVNFPLHFNLAHSGDWLVVAVSDRSPVGVDLEKIRPRPYQQLIDRYFSSREGQWFSHQAAEELFYRAWVAKEAYAKLLELPLLPSLRQLETIPLLTERKMTVVQPGPQGGEITIEVIDSPPGYAAALAYRTL